MAKKHIYHTDSGKRLEKPNWSAWVSASRTRNFLLGDPILDWLELYGEDEGFHKDSEQKHHDPRTDFLDFIFRKGQEFELAILALLRQKFGADSIATIASTYTDAKSAAKAEATFDQMAAGVPFLYQAVLRDPENRCYGMPDLLVRSDYLNRLVQEPLLTDADVARGAPGLGLPAHHYRVVDIKFSTLNLDAQGISLLNSGSKKSYKAQVALYNRALGRIQEYAAPQAYILGRKWEYQSKGKTYRGQSALERLAAVELNGLDRDIQSHADAALDWVRRLREMGASWNALPQPSIPELRPNAGNQSDQPWHGAKSEILSQTKDLTMLWSVGNKGRDKAKLKGFSSWDAKGLTPALLGKKGYTARILQAILDAQRDASGQLVFPQNIVNNKGGWKERKSLEFYVDFETVSDLDDDFSALPEAGGQPLIFMVGCGYADASKPDSPWTYRSFTVTSLTEAEEVRILQEWTAWMRDVTDQVLGQGADLPPVIHWSNAEASFLGNAYNSAQERQPEQSWPEIPWFDFLSEVVKKEPIVIKGCLAFGLKAIAKTMHGHGLISTSWKDGSTDGLGAMVGAWWCHHEALRLGCSMTDLDLMQEIADYNEVDCRVMWEIVRYLREKH